MSTSIDPRPWEIDRIPLKEFAAFTDEISPQVYWQSFATAANVRKYRAGGEEIDVAGITPRFVIASAARRLAEFGRPLHPIGDGTVATRSAWSDFIDESYSAEARSVSVWRFGVADAGIWEVLKETPPRRVSYVVRPGDTLGAIAARWGTTVDAIVRANEITNPNLIAVGTTLRAPGGAVV
ncbi:MAG: LysM domain-containing protein, partial [Chloroflexi bacterium]|nr:LysM domain-containing protein [Chloroflexota bacterium]